MSKEGTTTHRVTRGGSWVIRMSWNIDRRNADLPDTASSRGGFRTFRNCKQPQTKENARDGQVQ